MQESLDFRKKKYFMKQWYEKLYNANAVMDQDG